MLTRFPVSAPPVRVGRISYMNVAPVYHGLDNGLRPGWMTLVSGPPARLNALLADPDADLAVSPVSSAAYAGHADDWTLLPDLSISCRGPVMSVLLVSRRPMDDLDGAPVILTDESAAAAALLRLLFADGGVHPRFATGRVRRPHDLPGAAEAALVIGDAALREPWGDRFEWVYDLGKLWWDRTGLPFVFAVWAVRRDFADAHPHRSAAIRERFDASRRHGARRMDRIIGMAADRLGLPRQTCRAYYRRLRYDLEPDQIAGLQAFFDGLHRHGILDRRVTPSFFDPYAGTVEPRKVCAA